MDNIKGSDYQPGKFILLVCGALALGLGVIFLAYYLTAVGSTQIQPYERGIISSFGKDGIVHTEVLEPGQYWSLPGETITIYSLAPQTYTMSSTTESGDDSVTLRTSDGIELEVSIRVTYSIDPENVLDLHNTWQNRHQDDLIRPKTRGSVRNIASQYTAETLLDADERSDFEEALFIGISSSFEEHGIQLLQLEILNVQASER